MSNILFIDDDLFTIDPICMHLRICGHDVHIASGADDALPMLEHNSYDYIFLDVMFSSGSAIPLEDTAEGRYTGLRLADILYSETKYRHLSSARVMFVTNWRDEPEVDAVASRHGIPVLRKPLDIGAVEVAMGLT